MHKCPSAYVFRRYNIVPVEAAALPLPMTPPPVI